MSTLEELQSVIDKSKRIVFFGGAGVSTESGIPDFRSVDGLYNQKYDYPPEQILSHTFFVTKQASSSAFTVTKCSALTKSRTRRTISLQSLKRQESFRLLSTQNIDGLHQAAGSKNVLELHGSIHRNYCMKCHKFYDAAYVKHADGIPRCSCGGMLKPDVVLYEEGLDSAVINKSVKAISEADTLIIGGTSLIVYPAAGFIDYFRGKHLVVINKGATAREVGAELTIAAPIGEILGQIKVQ